MMPQCLFDMCGIVFFILIRCHPPNYRLLSTFFEKTLKKICRNEKNFVPLHPQTRKESDLKQNDGALAQLVEHRTENPCVPGSIPGGTTPPFIMKPRKDFGRSGVFH